MIASGVGHLGRESAPRASSPGAVAVGLRGARPRPPWRSPGSRTEPASTTTSRDASRASRTARVEAAGVVGQAHVRADRDAVGVGEGDRRARADARSTAVPASASVSPEQPGRGAVRLAVGRRDVVVPAGHLRRSRRGSRSVRHVPSSARRSAARVPGGDREPAVRGAGPGRRRSGRRPSPTTPSRDRLHSAGVVRVVTSSQRSPVDADEDDRRLGVVGRLRRAARRRHREQRRPASAQQPRASTAPRSRARARAGRGQHRSSLRAHYPRPRGGAAGVIAPARVHIICHAEGRHVRRAAPRYAYLGPAGHVHRGRAAPGRRAADEAAYLPQADVVSAIEAVRTGDGRLRRRRDREHRRGRCHRDARQPRGRRPAGAAARDARAGAVHARRGARGARSRTSGGSPPTRTRGCSAGAGSRAHLPGVVHVPATSNTAPAALIAGGGRTPTLGFDAALVPPAAVEHYGLAPLADGRRGQRRTRMTRFVVVGHPGDVPPPTGADKTTLVVHLPEQRGRCAARRCSSSSRCAA